MMDYKIVIRSHPNELAKVVGNYLRQGWMLRGNTTHAPGQGGYTQEIVRSGRREPLATQQGNAEPQRVPE